MREAATRPNWTLIACFLVGAILFLAANRAAYKGFFSDDDLDNLGWPTFVGPAVYLQGFASLKFDGKNFRPAGDLYYRELYRTFGLHFPPFIAVLQLIHAINVILLFLVLRQFNLSRMTAGAGAVFYSFHAAVLEIYWKPMYVFDLLCATFCLATLLLYMRGRWLLAFLTFWLAWKSKEIALMLPIALLAWEWLFGQRRWRRLIPFLLVSAVIGAQVLWLNRTIDPGNPYALRFTPDALWHSIAFYSSQVFFGAFAGLALVTLPIWVRDRLLYFGLIWMLAMLAPLLAMHQRLDGVYWYVPLVGVALVIVSISERTPRWAIALLFAIWLPVNFAMLRDKRSNILAQAGRDRALLARLHDYARTIPTVRAVVFQNTPEHVEWWGVHGAISLIFGRTVESAWSRMPEAQEVMTKAPMALIRFAPNGAVQGLYRTSDGAEAYLRFSGPVPEQQLGSGWLKQEGDARWAGPEAHCDLFRPASATVFEIMTARPSRSNVTVLEDGRSLGTMAGAQTETMRWTLPAGGTGEKHITVISDGIAVTALGYLQP